MSKSEHEVSALQRAIAGNSTANYVSIFEGFAAKGIPMDDIKPRENVFTFDGWKALGRIVRRNEHGVKVATILPCKRVDRTTGEVVVYKKPHRVTVFHISQTQALA